MKLTTTSLVALCAAGSALAGPVKNHGKHARLHNHMHRRFDNLTAPAAPKVYGSQGITVETTVTVQPIEHTVAATSGPATDSALVSYSSADGTVQALSPSVNAVTRTEVSTATYTVGSGPTASETTNQYEVIITDYVTQYVTVIVEGSAGSPAPTSTGSDGNVPAYNHAAPSASSESEETAAASAAPAYTPAAYSSAVNSPAAYTSASPSDAAEPSAYSSATSDAAPEAQITSYAQGTTMSIMPTALYTNASGAANYTAPHPGTLFASKKTKTKTKTKNNKKASSSSSSSSSKFSPYFSSFTATSTTTLESTTTTKQTSVTTKTQSSSSSSSSSLVQYSSTLSSSSTKSSASSSSVKSSSSSVVPSTTSSSSIKSSTSTSASSTSAAAVTASAPAPTGTGTVSGCTEWYVVQSGDYCSLIATKFGLDVNVFMSWNPSVNAPSCSSLILGWAYCVATTGTPVVSSSAAASTVPAGVSTTASSAPASTATGSYAYKMYSGNGTVEAGWPAMSQWLDFETMFNFNIPIMQQSCSQWNVPNNSPDEIADIKSAVQTISASSGVDARFIFAIIMQESNGCVRVITTNYGVNNPGLMQDHDGTGSCNIGGVVQTPCPASEITQMITDGTEGTASGDGLKQCIAETKVSDVSMYYGGARIYNGGLGGYHPDNLGEGCCTLCYSSDVANRLTGWHSGPSGCTL